MKKDPQSRALIALAGIKPALWSRPDKSLVAATVQGARALVDAAFTEVGPQGGINDASVHARLVALR